MVEVGLFTAIQFTFPFVTPVNGNIAIALEALTGLPEIDALEIVPA